MLAELHMADPLNLAAIPPGQKPVSRTNYDEAKANPFPLTSPLVLKNGKTVTDAATWWDERRPEILNDFSTEIYGKIPADAPKVTWEVTKTDPAGAGGTAIVKTIVGHIDNSAWPAASAHIDLTLYIPAGATGPVPVIVEVVANTPANSGRLPGAASLILAKGWGCAVASTYTVQADTGAGLGNGVIGIVNHGQERQPDQWGALAAWSWGLSRVIDYLANRQGRGCKTARRRRAFALGQDRAALRGARSALVDCLCQLLGRGGRKAVAQGLGRDHGRYLRHH